MNKFIYIFMFLTAIPYSGIAQSIEGTVTYGLQKKALAHATIRSIGTKNTTISDQNGQFRIKVSENIDTLEVSHIGFITQRISVSTNMSHVDVILLQSEENLEEIFVNTGYQKIKPNELNGSVTIIDEKTLSEQVGTNILDRIKYITNGLLFDDTKQLNQNKTLPYTVRGTISLMGNQDPLIVLDGFIYEGNLDNINPNDVENITILKDASAASIWGSRAGNGVIVISTKRSEFNQPTKIKVGTNFMITPKTDYLSAKQMSVSDYIEVEEYLFNNGFYNSLNNPTTARNAVSPAIEIFYKRKNNLISAADSASEIDRLKQIDTRKYLDKFQRSTIINQNFVRINGGENKHAYSFFLGYNTQVNSMHGTRTKANIQVNNKFKLNRKSELEISGMYTNTKNVGDRQVTTTVGNKPIPYLELTDSNGRPLPIPYTYRKDFTDTVGNGALLDWSYTPFEDWKYIRKFGNIEELNTNIKISHKLTSWITSDARFQYQKQNSISYSIYDEESHYVRSLINRFTNLTPGLASNLRNPVPYGGIKTGNMGSTSSYTARIQISIDPSTKNIPFNAILGSEIREVKSLGSEYTLYGYNEDPILYQAADFVNQYPQYLGGLAKIPGAPLDDPLRTSRFVSLFGNASYIHNKKYSISLSARKDGSNILGAETNKKWKPLWSAGLGWDLSRETFIPKPINYLKVRLSYGFAGNLNNAASASAIVQYSNSSITGFPKAGLTQAPNPDLTWERVKTWNIGMDFSGFSNRISGSFDYFIKKGLDLFGNVNVDYTALPFEQAVRNLANTEAKGFDITIKTTNIQRKIRWNSTIQLNRVLSKTTTYQNERAILIMDLVSDGTRISPIIGMPLYALAAYRWGGLDSTGRPMGYINGQLSKSDQPYSQFSNQLAFSTLDSLKSPLSTIKFFGSSMPVLWGSFTNHVSWKGLSVSAVVSYELLFFFKKSAIDYSALINSGVGQPDFENRWQRPGDELTTTIPLFQLPLNTSMYTFYKHSEVNVLPGDNIQLRNINLSYSFKTRYKFIENVQTQFNVSNLGFLWLRNKEKINPKTGDVSTPKSPRIYTFGLTASLK